MTRIENDHSINISNVENNYLQIVHNFGLLNFVEDDVKPKAISISTSTFHFPSIIVDISRLSYSKLSF